MLRARQIIAAILLSAIFTSYVGAQTAQMTSPQQEAKAAAPAVTASASGGGARYTAPGEVLQIRLEIYAASGELVFDSGQRAGSVINWKVADVQNGMIEGSYISVVTVKDLRGKLSQRLGSVTLQGGSVSVGRAAETELSAAQAQALGAARQSRKIAPAGDDAAQTILREGKERAVTVTTHDGQNGQVTSTSGALTLGTGDVLTSNDKEHVRITPTGQVGIGTTTPEATLDVAGTIRARGGIRFDDGTVLTSAGPPKSTLKDGAQLVATPFSANLGTGTNDKLLKWTNGSAGEAGDSVVSESAGNIGIGTSTPNNKLHVVGRLQLGSPTAGPGVDPTLTNANNIAGFSQFQFYPSAGTNTNMSFAVVPRGTGSNSNRAQFTIFNTDFINDPTNYEFASLRARGVDFTLGTGRNGSGVVRPLMLAAGYLSDNVTNDGQLFLATNGRIGVGTKTPQSRLDVAGDVRLSATGSGIIFSDGTKMTTAGSGALSGNSIVAAINDAATSSVIIDTRISPNMARLNGANAWTGANVFGAGLSANNALITNVGNPVNAGDAVNKAYADANFVRFVPGAEQLSVGDANGTAPMINLRGGSTCCSGPGGHTPAWFKVFQNGSFVATGNLGIGVSPMPGKGYRTSWDSYKGAFRSGYADNEWDDANVGFFSWAGGSNSTAIGLYALAFGDTNSAESTSSIVFGSGNQVKGAAGFSAGAGNRVCDTYGVALGNNAKSGGPLINGRCDPDTFNIRGLAAVAIGYNVTADQDHTTAMGKFASNNGFSGTFIWSDGSATASADTFRNTANNEFAVRASGGVRFRTNLGGTTGCNLPAGSGVFNCTSSRTTKENFLAVDGDDVLNRLRKVPVSSWNYITEGSQVRHLGPMAEDFHQAFGLGTDNKSIGVQDLAGVSLVAVKALEARATKLQESNAQLSAGLEQKTAEVNQLRSELDSLRATTNALAERLDALEKGQQTGSTKPRN